MARCCAPKGRSSAGASRSAALKKFNKTAAGRHAAQVAHRHKLAKAAAAKAKAKAHKNAKPKPLTTEQKRAAKSREVKRVLALHTPTHQVGMSPPKKKKVPCPCKG